tara:strand:+ start:532 stop:2862 length:2331 start_codon:yes stop_codon:yes gene_type:complete
LVSPAEERALLYAQAEAGFLGRIDDLTTLLNAALNKQPKEVGDIIINDAVVNSRNELVNDPFRITEAIEDFDKKHGWDAFGLDPSTNYDMKQLSTIRDNMSTQKFTQYEEYTPTDVTVALREMADEIVKVWDSSPGVSGDINEALDFVAQNAFYNWDYNPESRKSTYTDRELDPQDLKETLATNIVDEISFSYSHSPQYLTKNDYYWAAVDEAIDTGIYPPEIELVLKGKVTDAIEATRILESFDLQISGLQDVEAEEGLFRINLDPVAALDGIASTFNDKLVANIESNTSFYRRSGNVETAIGNLAYQTTAQGGPEDAYPIFAEEERGLVNQLEKFQEMGWDFTKDISTNIKNFFKGRKFTDPNNVDFPEEWTSTFTGKEIQKVVGDWERDLILAIESSEAGKAYTDAFMDKTKNPSPDMGLKIFNMLDGAMGQDNQLYSEEVLNTLSRRQQQANREKFRENLSTYNGKAAIINEYINTKEGFRDLDKDRKGALRDELTRIMNDIPVGFDEEGNIRKKSIEDYESFDEFFNDPEISAQAGTISERLDPSGPPAFPSTFQFEGKTFDIPGLVARPTPQKKEFDFSLVAPELSALAVDRPEFAKFLAEQIKLPGFAERYRELSIPQLDEESYNEAFALDPSVSEELEIAKQEISDIEKTMRIEAQEDVDEAAQGMQQQIDQERQSRLNELRQTEKMYSGQTGLDPEVRQSVRERFTTPGLTQEQFFAQQLPGFERRFEESPFFKLEQERKEREDEQRRRPLLRTGGRGRTIVTRGRQ